jgi:hypothetical protein
MMRPLSTLDVVGKMRPDFRSSLWKSPICSLNLSSLRS